MAASCAQKPTTEFLCFNTQPPEGGCVTTLIVSTIVSPFQHTATRRWLLSSFEDCISVTMFQHTATRRWLRAFGLSSQAIFSFNTQPPEGGCFHLTMRKYFNYMVSTHSHPKVAANRLYSSLCSILVSTHSHPKVAALPLFFSPVLVGCFNTQPPEGGCQVVKLILLNCNCFNTQPPEGGCSLHKKARKISKLNTVFR